MKKIKTQWNLGLLYKNHNDPQIEKDIIFVEKLFSDFEKKYRNNDDYLNDENKLLEALSDFENLFNSNFLSKPLSYFHYVLDLNSSDSLARIKSNNITQRFLKNDNKIIFFELALAKIPKNIQKKFLESSKLSQYKYFLKNIFDRSQYDLSEKEETIMGLKSVPSHQLWTDITDKLLNKITVSFNGKEIPISEASNKIGDLSLKPRRDLYKKVIEKLESISDIAESEINAIVINKKINDELRGFKEPYDSTILSYQNDKKSVLALVEVVTKNFKISHKFYKLKSKLLNLKKLEYCDRNVGIGKISKEISFDEGIKIVKKSFGKANQKYEDIIDQFIMNGQIDVFPKKGKTGGAYCSGNQNGPTFVLLNYTNNNDSVSTFAHEMGHAIHTEFSKKQRTIYQDYSISTAEVASTFFESIVFDEIFENLSDKEKVSALHNRINDDIQTIFRQIACFNFEKELHDTVRQKGGMSKKEICSLMNKHMKSYLGPVFDIKDIDGNIFVGWPHIRSFFYVYSYAFGQLISKALYEKYKADKNYLFQIEKFLSAGGSDTPENIFKSIGIDVTKPDFWITGLKSIENDIKNLENMIN